MTQHSIQTKEDWWDTEFRNSNQNLDQAYAYLKKFYKLSDKDVLAFLKIRGYSIEEV